MLHLRALVSRTSPLLLVSAVVALAIGGCDKDTKPAATAPSGASKTAAAQDDGGEAPAGEPGTDKAGTPGERVKVVEGAPAGADDRFALHVDTPEAKAGQEGEVMVRVVPKEPWHMNLDYPTSLKVAAPEGVTLAKADLKKADAKKLDESACEFAVKFTPAAAGEQSFTGEFKFAVCQDEACAPVTKNLEFKVAVK
jgi:hypothetical protein